MGWRIKGWNKFQHFKDRRPPWIKLYRDILDDPDWNALSGESAKGLVMLWVLASEADGHLPDIRKLAFRLRLPEKSVQEILDSLSHWVEESDEPYSELSPKEIAAKNGFGSRHITDQVRRMVWDRDGGACVACSSTQNIEYDHKTPVSLGGTSDVENIQLLCRSCNRKKRAKTAEQFVTHAQPTLNMRTPETETETETETEASNKRPFAEPLTKINQEFLIFYECYPRKEGKGAALKAYEKARKLASAEQILNAAKKYRDKPGREPKFTAMPATWLNQGRWEDQDEIAPGLPIRPKRTPLGVGG